MPSLLAAARRHLHEPRLIQRPRVSRELGCAVIQTSLPMPCPAVPPDSTASIRRPRQALGRQQARCLDVGVEALC